MDYAILIFLAIGVLGYMAFKMKLALLDAATPKFGGYPVGNNADGAQNYSIHRRYDSGSTMFLFLIFGAILIVMYFMHRTGYDPNQATDYVIEEVLQKDIGSSPTYKDNRKNSESQIARENYRPDDMITDDRLNKSPRKIQASYIGSDERPARKAESAYHDYEDVNKEVFWLQIGAFGERRFALELVNDLNMDEYEIVEEDDRYKVRLGPFSSKSEASAYKKKYGGSFFVPGS